MNIKNTHIRFDWAIKKILRSKANFGVLEGFLSELLKIDITILNILESESNKESAENKLNRVDILVEDAHKKLYIIEVQNGSEIDYFHRMAFAASRLMSEYLDSSNPYGNIRKIITVNIIYFDLGQGQDYVYHGTNTFIGLHNPQDILLPSQRQMKEFDIKTTSDIFPEHYIIKVNNFNDLAKDSLDQWIYFFKNSAIPDEFTAKGLDLARSRLLEISLDPKERGDYKFYIKRLHDEASFAFNAQLELKDAFTQGEKKGLEEGIEQGIEQGLKQGLEKGLEEGRKHGALDAKLQIAKDLLKINMPQEQILNLTQISLEELKKIQITN